MQVGFMGNMYAEVVVEIVFPLFGHDVKVAQFTQSRYWTK